ncbi:Uncharacterized protein TCM_025522 [Theobroma cacao]|uniref:Uncharacterized protein n=1 Tax=Theobroma cacao TaxID=3641 RepID=A0A061F6P0_THECC|nr:Uncharacterized protein TCM_025522 [Theobroma cacao]
MSWEPVLLSFIILTITLASISIQIVGKLCALHKLNPLSIASNSALRELWGPKCSEKPKGSSPVWSRATPLPVASWPYLELPSTFSFVSLNHGFIHLIICGGLE